MTDQAREYEGSDGGPLPPPLPPRRKRQVFKWFFWGVQALFVFWIISAIGASGSTDCGTLSAEACQDAQEVGTALGVMLVIFLWAAVDIILGVIYLIRRKS